AGGQWRSHAKADEKEVQDWDIETYRTWFGDVKGGNGPERGLGIVPSTLFWSNLEPETIRDLWWRDLVNDFIEIPASELPEQAKAGVSFSTICINVPKHLQYLKTTFQAEGGRLVKTKISTVDESKNLLKIIDEIFRKEELGPIDVFVNATGLGARDLVGDMDVFPVQGQTILVKGEAKCAKTLDENRYVIPRPGSGTTILGGTRDRLDGPASSWSTEVGDATTKAILAGCKDLASELLNGHGEFEVLSVQCGLRPARKGGPRVELEQVGEEFDVVHAYGHAGAG
ncbi:MAG: hypothetical protein Q9217_004053, partial [Psora testacea]